MKTGTHRGNIRIESRASACHERGRKNSLQPEQSELLDYNAELICHQSVFAGYAQLIV